VVVVMITRTCTHLSRVVVVVFLVKEVGLKDVGKVEVRVDHVKATAADLTTNDSTTKILKGKRLRIQSSKISHCNFTMPPYCRDDWVEFLSSQSSKGDS